jgi:hypothetical protein
LRSRCVTLVVLAVLGAGAPARAVPERAWQVAPPEALAVVLLDGRTVPDSSAPLSAGRMALAFLQQTRDMGLWRDLDPTLSVAADLIALHEKICRYPRALVLLDVRTQALSGGGFRFAGLSGGLVVLTGGDHRAVGGAIQSTLNLRTDRNLAELTQREVGGRTVYTLTDRRLADWAVIEWGAVEDAYVISVGTGAFERIAAAITDSAKSLGGVSWIMEAHRRCRGPAARWEWMIDFNAVRTRLTPAMGRQPAQVLDALELGNVARGLWAVGLAGRTVDAACVLDEAGETRYLPLTLTGESAQPYDRLIPPTEENGTVLDARLAEMIPRVCQAFVAARSPYFQERAVQRWADLQKELGIDVQTDLLNQLSRYVILHNYPPHPLRLPWFATLVIPLTGSPDSVRPALDGLLTQAQRYIADPERALDPLRLGHDADGVWYIQYGLYGPALVVMDRWLVISYTPQAVRQNVQYLQDLERRASTQPVSQP